MVIKKDAKDIHKDITDAKDKNSIKQGRSESKQSYILEYKNPQKINDADMANAMFFNKKINN